MTRQTEAHAVRDVDLEGIVRAVEIDDSGGGTFKLLLDSGDTLTSPFARADDMIITQALREHRTLRLAVGGPCEFDADGKPRRLLRLQRCELSSEFSRSLKASVAGAEKGTAREEGLPSSTGQSILKMFEKIHKSAPEGTWDDVPTDGSINYKHYLYGYPKREVD